MIHRLGLLSDTHLNGSSRSVQKLVRDVFTGCELIIHAGDLTSLSVLEAFEPTPVLAVAGNMCSFEVRQKLPRIQRQRVGGKELVVCHGDGLSGAPEEQLFTRFGEADCIVYGHTHRPATHRFGKTLVVNPGSFKTSGPHGSPGSYAILEISAAGITVSHHQLSPRP